MAVQLMLWAKDVLECQRTVSESECKMLKAKTVYLEKKHAFENAKKELHQAIVTEVDDVDLTAE